MNTFQFLGLGFLAVVAMRTVVGMSRVAGSRRGGMLRMLIVAAAAVAIAEPSAVQRLANAMGIGRGADVVLYSFALAFLATTFYFYARYLRLQQQVTELVRHVAISEARRGGAPDTDAGTTSESLLEQSPEEQ